MAELTSDSLRFGPDARRDQSATSRATVVNLDMVKYSPTAIFLEGIQGPEGVKALNQRIQDIIDKGLQAAEATRQQAVIKMLGDGAILCFETPSQAHRFGKAVIDICHERNRPQHDPLTHMRFRIGVATGELTRDADIAGVIAIDATRLQTAARPAEMLADSATYELLPPEVRRQYGEAVRVKTNDGRRISARPFPVRRCCSWRTILLILVALLIAGALIASKLVPPGPQQHRISITVDAFEFTQYYIKDRDAGEGSEFKLEVNAEPGSSTKLATPVFPARRVNAPETKPWVTSDRSISLVTPPEASDVRLVLDAQVGRVDKRLQRYFEETVAISGLRRGVPLERSIPFHLLDQQRNYDIVGSAKVHITLLD